MSGAPSRSLLIFFRSHAQNPGRYGGSCTAKRAGQRCPVRFAFWGTAQFFCDRTSCAVFAQGTTGTRRAAPRRGALAGSAAECRGTDCNTLRARVRSWPRHPHNAFTVMSASDDGTRREARDSAAAARLARKVARPLLGALPSELVEILPGVEPGVVPVVEYQFHRVLTDRLDGCDADVLLAEDQHLLAGSVTFDFG